MSVRLQQFNNNNNSTNNYKQTHTQQTNNNVLFIYILYIHTIYYIFGWWFNTSWPHGATRTLTNFFCQPKSIGFHVLICIRMDISNDGRLNKIQHVSEPYTEFNLSLTSCPEFTLSQLTFLLIQMDDSWYKRSHVKKIHMIVYVRISRKETNVWIWEFLSGKFYLVFFSFVLIW